MATQQQKSPLEGTHGIVNSLKSRECYNPSTIKLVGAELPPDVEKKYAPNAEILALKGDPAKEKLWQRDAICVITLTGQVSTTVPI